MLVNYIQRKQIDEQEVKNLLQSSFSLNHFTNNGPVKNLLEKLLHTKLGLSQEKSVVCLSNGTAACHALMLMYEQMHGKKLKWVVPSFTFPTPVVGRFSNVKVVDIDPETYTVSLGSEEVLKADGVIITNLFGTCNQIQEWTDFCKINNKILIFDNASSPMSSYKSKNICEFGDSSFGSLHHTKYLGFGEGGFVVVEKDLYDTVNSIANFGFKTTQRIHSSFSSNFKMSDIAAAYCYQQIKNYNLVDHLRVQNSAIERIKSIGIEIFNTNDSQSKYVLGNLPILFDKPIDTLRFRDLGVEANKYYRPIKNLRESKKIYSRMVNLPLNESLSDYQIDIMFKAVREVRDANR